MARSTRLTRRVREVEEEATLLIDRLSTPECEPEGLEGLREEAEALVGEVEDILLTAGEALTEGEVRRLCFAWSLLAGELRLRCDPRVSALCREATRGVYSGLEVPRCLGET